MRIGGKARSISTHPYKWQGLFASISVGGFVAYESTLERDFLFVIDVVPGVRHIESQPLKIRYSYDAASDQVTLEEDLPPSLKKSECLRSYVPDYLVSFWSRRPILFEIKPSARLGDFDVQLDARVGALYAERNGLEYRIVTEVEMKEYLGLARENHYYARYNVPTAVVDRVLDLFSGSNNPMTCDQLSQQIENLSSAPLVQVYAMLAKGILTAPNEKSFEPKCPVVPNYVKGAG